MADSTLGVRLSESTRVEAFSDAVMAIVITILVLELRVPAHEPGRLLPALMTMWAPVVAFLISFLRVSVIWLNHHGLFVHIRRVDRTILWLNLGILLNCMIVPLPTAILADALRDGNPSDLRAATVLYALLAALQSVAWVPVFRHLHAHSELLEPGTDASFFHTQPVRPWIAVGVDLAAAAVAMVSPVGALVLWTLSVTFLGVTSDGVQTMSLVARRRSRSSKAEYTA
jgi:uncharacterized membrane protein